MSLDKFLKRFKKRLEVGSTCLLEAFPNDLCDLNEFIEKRGEYYNKHRAYVFIYKGKEYLITFELSGVQIEPFAILKANKRLKNYLWFGE